MSIPVALSDLAQAMARYRFAYLLTASSHGAPHATAVSVALVDGLLQVGQTGRRTRENALREPAVALVWPPLSDAEHSLIVDGTAAVEGQSMRITPARAVRHRSAPAPDPVAPGACGLGPVSAIFGGANMLKTASI